MTEAAVVNAFFTFRVFLVGGILLAFPRISRKGLMFGTYLGEEEVDGTAAGKLMRSWDIGCAMVMLVSLLVGWSISLGGQPVRGNLTGTAVLLLLSPLLYLWMYQKARALAPPTVERQAMRASASLDVDEARGDGFAKLALAACLVTALASAVHATRSYEAMPDLIPTLANLLGFGDELVQKSLAAVVLLPSINLVMGSFFALMGLLIVGAKRSLRGGSGGRSAEAQEAFRIAFSRVYSGIGLCICVILTVMSVEMIKVALRQSEALNPVLIGGICVATVIYMFVSLFRIMRLGQGGARLEDPSVESPLGGGLADNAHWILGVMYVDKTDPSLMVENRFGIGYTMNLGNRLAVGILVCYLTAILGLIVLTLMELGLLFS